MKKIISVLLAVAMLFSMAVIGVSAEKADELVVTVANDLHYHMAGSAALYQGIYTEDYANATSTGQLRLESELIIDEFLERAAEDESSVILIPGDIVDNGLEAEHLVMASKFAQFETETDKQVYVIPGNHDYYTDRGGSMTPDKFKAYYSAFGYAQAIAVDTKTASYVAELNDEYRILGLDSCTPGKGNEGVTEELIEWVKVQAEQAQTDGKHLIAMSHYNLLQHLVLVDVVHKGSVIDKDKKLAEVFAQYNIKYTFVGHTHDQDIASYTGANGNTIYDILTSTINAYPCPYRTVSFGENVKVETKFIDSVDTASLNGKITDATYGLATENFPEYTKNILKNGIGRAVSQFVTVSKLKSMLSLDAQEDAELCATVDKIVPSFNEVINMPLYTENETEKGKSIESIASQYNLYLPESDYENMIDFAVSIYLAHILGDEDNGVLSDDYAILTTGLTATLNYVLSDVTSQEYAQVMTFACSFLGADVPVDFFKYAGSGLKKAEGIELFITGVASPLILEFTTDEGPADNDVTLEGYGTEYEEPAELTFWEKIIKFFKDMFAYIVRILGF